MPMRNVLGGPLEPCGTDPLTGSYRDGCCSTGLENTGQHTICAGVTAQFGAPLATTCRRRYRSTGSPASCRVTDGVSPSGTGSRPTAKGCAAPVVPASTHERILDASPLTACLRG
jgi:uncharacterized protein (DUF2237 family)